jgi:hypothetical protein
MLQVIMYQRLVACTTAKSFVLAAHLINGLIHGQFVQETSAVEICADWRSVEKIEEIKNCC